MALRFNTLPCSSATTVVALVCLANPGTPLAAARRGVDWLASQCWGAAVKGDGYTTFMVDVGWDGAAHVGYFAPTLAEVANDVGPDFWVKGPVV